MTIACQFTMILILIGPISVGISGYKIKCLEGWSGFSESQSCYKFFNREEYFLDAKMSCESTGGSLAIIDSKAGRDSFLNFWRTYLGNWSINANGQLCHPFAAKSKKTLQTRLLQKMCPSKPTQAAA